MSDSNLFCFGPIRWLVCLRFDPPRLRFDPPRLRFDPRPWARYKLLYCIVHCMDTSR